MQQHFYFVTSFANLHTMYYSVFRLEVYVMEHRLPYYMAYPMPMQYDDERMERRDFEYMKSMYPMTVKRILPYVEEECDRMSYEGSMIYDEYPDRYSLQRLAGSIIQVMKNEEKNLPEEERTPEDKWLWLKDMMQVLLCNEIYKRRHGGRRGFLKF